MDGIFIKAITPPIISQPQPVYDSTPANPKRKDKTGELLKREYVGF